MKNHSIGIIGGGLTGLSAAYFLKKAKIDSTIIEARERLGGRIHTLFSESEAPIELGATWLGKKHSFLLDLLSELGIDIFEQYMGKYAIYEPISTSPPQIVQMPFNPDPTYRIKGGTSILINRLANELNKNSMLLNTIVKSIKSVDNKIILETDKDPLAFDKVLITLPSKLFLDTVKFEPTLPKEIHEIGHQTHTWMSESIKIALTYKRSFWRDEKPIGSIFSNTGLISEMYDHSNFKESKFALKGFINGGYAFTSQEERKKRVLIQLSKYFGQQVEGFLSYHETIWRDEKFTHTDYDGFILPHQNNGNPIFQSTLMDGKLYIGGSETASKHPGYMDGAVESGAYSADRIKKALV